MYKILKAPEMSEETKQELRKCTSCRCEILLETYFKKNRKGEYNKTCNGCLDKRKEYVKANKDKIKEYYETNKDKLKQKEKRYREANKDKIKEKAKKYYEANKDKRKEYQEANKDNRKKYLKEYREANKDKYKQYREANKDKIRDRMKKYLKEYYEANKDKLKIQKQEYFKNKKHYCEHETIKRTCKICNPNGYLKSIVSKRIHEALKAKKSKKSLEYLGCDIQTFREHLEKTFKTGMTWENQGEWDIDHIIPVLYKQDGVEPSLEEVGKRLHYTNCQAMWHTENIKKGNRYIGDYQPDSE